MARKNNYPQYYHLLLHTILYLGDLQRRLTQLNDSKSTDTLLKELEKMQIIQLSKDTIKLLHAIEPSINFAQKEMPELSSFLVSCKDSLTRIKKDYAVEGKTCDCKGCNS